MHAHEFGPDILIYLSLFCDDLADIVRFWIAFSSLNKHIPEYDRAWREIIRFWAKLRDLGDLDDIIMRLGCRLSTGGVLLLERVCTERKCSRSGCLMKYRECNNHSGACLYHPGKISRGSLTCCKKASFKEPGCRTAFHDGALYESIYARREKMDEDDDGDEYYTGASELDGDIPIGLISKEFINKKGLSLDGERRRGSKRRSSGALSALLSLQNQWSMFR